MVCRSSLMMPASVAMFACWEAAETMRSRARSTCCGCRVEDGSARDVRHGPSGPRIGDGVGPVRHPSLPIASTPLLEIATRVGEALRAPVARLLGSVLRPWEGTGPRGRIARRGSRLLGHTALLDVVQREPPRRRHRAARPAREQKPPANGGKIQDVPARRAPLYRAIRMLIIGVCEWSV